MVLIGPNLQDQCNQCNHENKDDEECDESGECKENDGPMETRKTTKRKSTATSLSMSPREREYWNTMDVRTRARLEEVSKEMQDHHAATTSTMPPRFRVMLSNKDAKTKSVLVRKIEQIQKMHPGSGEYNKMNNWIENACRLPIGHYIPMAVNSDSTPDNVNKFLEGSRATMDKTVFGHSESKDQIMRIMAQWVANPGSKGNCFAISGPMGCGKTSLVKDGICKAMGLPFNLIALGGANDGSFLEGHGFTYEGSIYGKIAECLMKSQCMNPVIFFDELDKVSQTRHGEEIIGVLTHLTDSTQNDRYTDRYFSELELDLSRALFVFSYNDESLINPILKDRMITIQAKGYNKDDKINIARNYLVPNILSQFGVTATDINIPTSAIERIISRVTAEQGVRNLKRGIENVISWINMHRFIPQKTTGTVLTFPVEMTEEMIDKYIERSTMINGMSAEVHHMMYS